MRVEKCPPFAPQAFSRPPDRPRRWRAPALATARPDSRGVAALAPEVESPEGHSPPEVSPLNLPTRPAAPAGSAGALIEHQRFWVLRPYGTAPADPDSLHRLGRGSSHRSLQFRSSRDDVHLRCGWPRRLRSCFPGCLTTRVRDRFLRLRIVKFARTEFPLLWWFASWSHTSSPLFAVVLVYPNKKHRIGPVAPIFQLGLQTSEEVGGVDFHQRIPYDHAICPPASARESGPAFSLARAAIR